MRVHDNSHRLIRHEAFRLALINKKPFRQAAGLYSLDHFPGRIILFGNDDVRFHLGHSRQVGNTYRGPKRVKIFMGVPHNENHIRFVNDLTERLRHHTDTDTGTAHRSRRFAAKGFYIFPETDDGLIPAAAKSQIKRHLGFFILAVKRFVTFYDADGQGHGNTVHRMDFPHPVKYFKIRIHHILQGL